MIPKSLRALFQVFASLIILYCIITVYSDLGPVMPGFTAGNFLSYFTIQSNILTVIFLLYSALTLLMGRPQGPRPKLEHTRSMLLLFMGITTSIYWLLLHRHINIPEQATRDANVGLHWIAFCALLIDSFLGRPTSALRPQIIWFWLLYPLFFGVYTLLRGAYFNWYPYPFLDVGKLGYPKVLLISLVSGLGFVGFARLIILFHNRVLLPVSRREVSRS